MEWLLAPVSAGYLEWLENFDAWLEEHKPE